MTVLFDLSNQLWFSSYIPLGIILAVSTVALLVIGVLVLFKRLKNVNIISYIALFFCLMLLFVGDFIFFDAFVEQRTNVYVPFKNGEVKSVEGKVENLVKVDSRNNLDETFTVNGVDFSFSPFDMIIGYKDSATYGGKIDSDGILVKIDYVYDVELKKNIIVKLEADI